MSRPHLVTAHRSQDGVEIVVNYRGKDHLLDVDAERLFPFSTDAAHMESTCRDVLPLLSRDIERLLDSVDQKQHNVPDQAVPTWTCASCLYCQMNISFTFDCDKGHFAQDRRNHSFGPGSMYKAASCPDFSHVRT